MTILYLVKCMGVRPRVQNKCTLKPICHFNKQCGRRVRPTRYARAPDRLQPDLSPFDFETPVRVASKAGNLIPNLGTLYATDGQTDGETDGQKQRLVPP